MLHHIPCKTCIKCHSIYMGSFCMACAMLKAAEEIEASERFKKCVEQSNKQDKEKRPLTIFLDIDGCILEHAAHPNGHIVPPEETILLPGTVEKFNEWIMKEYKIILTTGRKECTRQQTEAQLRYHGLVWDQLIMGLGGGIRVLINDRKPSTDRDTAVAVTIKRNEGISGVNI